MNRRRFIKASTGALTLLSINDVLMATQLQNAYYGRNDYPIGDANEVGDVYDNAQYWMMSSAPDREGYTFNLVAFHNDLINELEGNGVTVDKAEMRDHPDYFSMISRGLVVSHKPIEIEKVTQFPEVFQQFEKNMALRVSEGIMPMDDPRLAPYWIPVDQIDLS